MHVSLGIDTSCYTTSAALTNEQGRVIASSRLLLPVAIGQRGLRQSEAVFAHVRQLPLVIKSLFNQVEKSEIDIVCICVSDAPRDEEESYMPVFQTGLSYAQVLSETLGIPLYRVSHQQGHIAAGWIGNDAIPEKFISLHLSGGTTELLQCNCGNLVRVGGSSDLHAGQLVDRIGVAMGLSFPAGAQLEKMAFNNKEPIRSLLPVSMEQSDLYCHLSGAETQAQKWISEGKLPRETIAAEVFDFLVRTVTRLLIAGCKKFQYQNALVVGGVASSELLREGIHFRLKKQKSNINVAFGQPQYSSDNAVGVAVLGIKKYLIEKGEVK